MLEYEKKIMLTSDEYNAIVGTISEYVFAQKQTNYYFDTDELSMSKQKITCRIREKDGKFKTTIKKHDTEHPDCSTEEDLAEKMEFDPQIFNALGLHYQGELVTERIVMYKDSCAEMVIDRNTYLGYTDFELEIEYSKESEHIATTLLESIGKTLVEKELVTDLNAFMERVGQAQSKSQRFFEKKIGGEKGAVCFK